MLLAEVNKLLATAETTAMIFVILLGAEVFNAFLALTQAPELLSAEVAQAVEAHGLERAVCDYLAGMTDRYALDEHERLYNPRRL